MQQRIYRLPGKTILFSLFAVLITGCMGVSIGIPTDEPIKTPISTPVVIFPAKVCPVTEPVQATPPDDPAVQNPPAEGN